jgi:hypothetical protein
LLQWWEKEKLKQKIDIEHEHKQKGHQHNLLTAMMVVDTGFRPVQFQAGRSR